MKFDSWINIQSIPALETRAVQLYKIDLEPRHVELDRIKLIPYLSADEIEKFNKYRFRKDKYAFALARYALRIICGHLLDRLPQELEFSYNTYGMPYLADVRNFSFNISHSGHMILLGVTRSPAIGVDVEQFKSHINHLELARSVFSKQEIAQLTSIASDQIAQAFYQCWTKKEAYIKAKGEGLHIPLRDFTVRIVDQGFHNLVRVIWNPEETSQWQLFNFEIGEGYRAACACDHSIQVFNFFDYGPTLFQKLSV